MPRLVADYNSDAQKAAENAESYAYCRDNGHLRFRDKAQRCESYLAGRQWDQASLTRLRRQRRPALTLNRLLGNYAAIAGEQLANQADVGFKPADQAADQGTADVLSKIWINVSQNNDFSWLESQMFDDGVITSRGFLDMRMDFRTNLAGDIRIKLKNSQNILIDPDADEYDPKTWNEVIESKWLSLDQIERMFGKKVRDALEGNSQVPWNDYGYDYMDQRPGTFGYSNYMGSEGTDSWQRYGGGPDRRWSPDAKKYRQIYRLIDRQYREVGMANFFVDPDTGDMKKIPVSMDRERIGQIMAQYGLAVIRQRTDIIRWCTTCGNIVLHNELSPYDRFTQIPYFPIFRHGETIGLVEGMIDPQQLYNKTRSQELHVVNTTANSGWKAKQGSLKNMTVRDLEERGAETGLVVEVEDVKDLEKIQPNQIPTGIERIGFLAAEDLKVIGMVSDSLRGFDRADVAAKAIQAKQAQGSTNFAKPMSNLAKTRKLVGEHFVYLVQSFYTNERVMRITGPLPGDKDEEFVINQMQATGEVLNNVTVGKYDVVVTSVPARETFSESQFNQGVAMREIGVPIPNSVLVRNSHLQGKAELADRLAKIEQPAEDSALDEQIAALEIRKKELENEKIEAEKQKIESETAKNLVEAQKTAASPTEEQVQSEEFKLDQAKFLAEREQALVELDQKQQQIDNEYATTLEELRIKRIEQRDQATQNILKLDNERRKLLQAQTRSTGQANKAS